MSLWYTLVELLPFEWAQPGSMYFMKNALLAVLVISPLLGLLSTMVVTNRMSFFSDALGHSAFTGIAIGSLCGLAEPMWCAVVFAVAFSLLFTYVRRKSNMPAIRSSVFFPPLPWRLVFLSPPWTGEASPNSIACS